MKATIYAPEQLPERTRAFRRNGDDYYVLVAGNLDRLRITKAAVKQTVTAARAADATLPVCWFRTPDGSKQWEIVLRPGLTVHDILRGKTHVR